MSLKEKILELKDRGISQSEIAKTLMCSPGTVSYHCNPEVKKKQIFKQSIRKKFIRKAKIQNNSLKYKELEVKKQNVSWQYSEIYVTAELVRLGYEVFAPVVGGTEIDIIAYKNGEIKRIQIKSISPNKDSINLAFKRHKSVNNYEYFRYENIDWFLVFDGTYIYKIDAAKYNNGITLRYKLPANNNTTNVHMASDFLLS